MRQGDLDMVVSPAEPVVSLTEMKLHLRVDHADEDAYITSLILSATDYAQGFTSRQFVTATYELRLDAFPASGRIYMPRPPIVQLQQIAYDDSDGVEQMVDLADVRVAESSEGIAYIDPAYNKSWPSTRDQSHAVRVQYQAGYGDAASVPESIKTAVRLIAAHHYEHREEVITGTIVSRMPVAAESLLRMYRVFAF